MRDLHGERFRVFPSLASEFGDAGAAVFVRREEGAVLGSWWAAGAHTQT